MTSSFLDALLAGEPLDRFGLSTAEQRELLVANAEFLAPEQAAQFPQLWAAAPVDASFEHLLSASPLATGPDAPSPQDGERFGSGAFLEPSADAELEVAFGTGAFAPDEGLVAEDTEWVDLTVDEPYVGLRPEDDDSALFDDDSRDDPLEER